MIDYIILKTLLHSACSSTKTIQNIARHLTRYGILQGEPLKYSNIKEAIDNLNKNSKHTIRKQCINLVGYTMCLIADCKKYVEEILANYSLPEETERIIKYMITNIKEG